MHRRTCALLRGRLLPARTAVALAVMAHARDVQLTDYLKLAHQGVSLVRLPARIDGMTLLAAHVAAAMGRERHGNEGTDRGSRA